MPIARDKFQRSKPGDPMNLIIEFLRSNSRYAYTQSEIKGELALKGIDLPAEEMQKVLTSLEALGRIESKTIEGETYYTYCKLIGVRPF